MSSSQESLAGDFVEPAVKREPIDGGEEDEYSEEDEADSEMSSDEMCLEAKEVVSYTSDESNSDEDDFRKDEDDSDYGDKKGNLRPWQTSPFVAIMGGTRRTTTFVFTTFFLTANLSPVLTPFWQPLATFRWPESLLFGIIYLENLNKPPWWRQRNRHLEADR